MNGETLIRTCAKMYQMRDDAKRIFGNEYTEHVQSATKLIRACAEDHNGEVLSAAIELAKDAPDSFARLVIAAAVEAIESDAARVQADREATQ